MILMPKSLSATIYSPILDSLPPVHPVSTNFPKILPILQSYSTSLKIFVGPTRIPPGPGRRCTL